MPTPAATRETTRGADHQCAAIGCTTQIPAAKFMCVPDWTLLSSRIRRKINYTWPRRKTDPDAYKAATRLATSAVQRVRAARPLAIEAGEAL